MRRLLLFVFTVLLPALVVGISNFAVFPDSILAASIMLLVTVGVAGTFTWLSGDAAPSTKLFVKCADFLIATVLCINLGCHWLLAREVSAARQGVEESHTEQDRQDRRASERAERELALKKADLELQKAESARLARLPRSERHSAITAPQVEPTKAPLAMSLVPAGTAISAPIVIGPRETPDEVRKRWWLPLTILAFAETFASVLSGAILAVTWRWDRNHDGIPDDLQKPQAAPGK